jgi:hypothetical protein
MGRGRPQEGSQKRGTTTNAEQDPPANTFGSDGPSPHNHFADELITEGRQPMSSCSNVRGRAAGKDWRIGIKGAIETLEACQQKVNYALEDLATEAVRRRYLLLFR